MINIIWWPEGETCRFNHDRETLIKYQISYLYTKVERHVCQYALRNILSVMLPYLCCDIIIVVLRFNIERVFNEILRSSKIQKVHTRYLKVIQTNHLKHIIHLLYQCHSLATMCIWKLTVTTLRVNFIIHNMFRVNLCITRKILKQIDRIEQGSKDL